MPIRVNGVTVIDESRNWTGNAIPASVPIVSTCTISGLSNVNLDIACANYYKIRANTPLTIDCICNISCCNNFFIDYASNDGSKISTLPACFSFTQSANNCESRNFSTVYKFENLNNKWIGSIVDRNLNFGDDPTPQSISAVCRYVDRIETGVAGFGMASFFKCYNNTSDGNNYGLCKDFNVLTFKYGSSIYTVSPSACPRGFNISEPIYSNLSTVRTICTYCSFCCSGNCCSMIPRLIGYSLKCDFILVGTFDCGVVNPSPSQTACFVLEAYKLTDAIQGIRTRIQFVAFRACAYSSTAAALRGCVCINPSCGLVNSSWSQHSGVGGYINNFNFDDCAVPQIVSDVNGYSYECNPSAEPPYNLGIATDGMKIWVGSDPSCIFCYRFQTSGYPGYTSNNYCQMICEWPRGSRAFYTKDGRYAITVDTLLYPCSSCCRFDRRVSIWRDTQFGSCLCTNFTTLATICDQAFGCSVQTSLFDLIFDCCMCHVLYFGKKGTSGCTCCSIAVGYSRTTDGCCYVISLPCLCCGSATGSSQNPYVCCGSNQVISSFGICLEKNCFYSTRLLQANGAVGCGASYNPALCRWNITTTPVDTCCFCCYYDYSSTVDMFTNPRDSANNYVNPFYIHALSNTKLLTI